MLLLDCVLDSPHLEQSLLTLAISSHSRALHGPKARYSEANRLI